MGSKPSIRLLIVNEVELMSNVIATALEDESDIEIIGRVTTVEEAIKLTEQSDILLVSSRLPDQGALRLTQAIAELAPSVKTVILGLNESEVEILKYVEAGAEGYILKDDSVDALLEKIRAIANDRAIVSPGIAAALIARVSELSQVFSEVQIGIGDTAELTSREEEILELIGQGLTNQEIADRLVIEVGTVKNHVHNILQKLDVSSREEAAAHLAIL